MSKRRREIFAPPFGHFPLALEPGLATRSARCILWKTRGFWKTPMRTNGVAGKSAFDGPSEKEGGFGFLLPASGQTALWSNGFVDFGLPSALGQMW